jgi:ribosome modulation factor
MSTDWMDLCEKAYRAGVAAGRDAKPGEFFEMPAEYLDDQQRIAYLDGWVEAREALAA